MYSGTTMLVLQQQICLILFLDDDYPSVLGVSDGSAATQHHVYVTSIGVGFLGGRVYVRSRPQCT